MAGLVGDVRYLQKTGSGWLAIKKALLTRPGHHRPRGNAIFLGKAHFNSQMAAT